MLHFQLSQLPTFSLHITLSFWILDALSSLTCKDFYFGRREVWFWTMLIACMMIFCIIITIFCHRTYRNKVATSEFIPWPIEIRLCEYEFSTNMTKSPPRLGWCSVCSFFLTCHLFNALIRKIWKGGSITLFSFPNLTLMSSFLNDRFHLNLCSYCLQFEILV